MQFSKCPVCKSTPSQPINLKCDHHPCFQCAISIMTVDQENDVETKYKIICPVCKKKTLTYDVRHLIIGTTQQDEDLYCTTKYISKKPEVVIKKSNSYVESDRNSFSSKKLSSHHHLNDSISQKPPIKLECKRHPTKHLQYYCETCFRNDHEDAFICQECANIHLHPVTNIRNAQYSLSMINQQKVSAVLPQYKNQLSKLIKDLGSKKQSLKMDYQKLQRQLTEEFKKVYQSINKQFETVKKDMKDLYAKQYDNVKNTLSLATRLKDSLSGLEKMYRFDSAEIQGQISFHNYFYEIGKAIQTNKKTLNKTIEMPQIVKRSLVAFSSQPLMEIRLQTNTHGYENHHQRKESKMSNTLMSPKAQDLGVQIQRPKKTSNMHSKKVSKQNLASGVSPRQKYSFQSLLFVS